MSERREPIPPSFLSKEVKEYTEQRILEMLERAEFVSSGKDGIVVKVKEAEEDSLDTAIKMLKIYNPQAANNEAAVHRVAFGALSEVQAHPDTHAMIPKPHGVLSVDIPENLQQQLSEKTANHVGPQVSVQVMDYIDADEFLVYLQRRYNQLVEGSDRPIQSFSPDHNNVDASERAREKNVSELLRVMRLSSKDEAAIHPSIIKKLQATIHLLHRNGVFHRDLHERNVLVRERVDGEYDVFVIDFGHSVVERERATADDVYRTDIGTYTPDETLVYQYKEITLTQSERRKQKSNELHENNQRLLRMIDRRGVRPQFDTAVLKVCSLLDQPLDGTDDMWPQKAFQLAETVFPRGDKESNWNMLVCILKQVFETITIEADKKMQLLQQLDDFAKKIYIPTGIAQHMYTILG